RGTASDGRTARGSTIACRTSGWRAGLMKAALGLVGAAVSGWLTIGPAAAADMPVSPPPPTGYYGPPVEQGYVAPPPPVVYAPPAPVYRYYDAPPVAVVPPPYYARPYYGWGYGRPVYGPWRYSRGYGPYGYRGYYR